MRNYSNRLFEQTLTELRQSESSIVNSQICSEDMLAFSYFLIEKFFYPVTVDDYPLEIIDKHSLLEALYYQVKLITMHDSNWDAFQEALTDASNYFSEYDGIFLIFKDGRTLQARLTNDFATFVQIVTDVSMSNSKTVKIILGSE